MTTYTLNYVSFNVCLITKIGSISRGPAASKHNREGGEAHRSMILRKKTYFAFKAVSST